MSVLVDSSVWIDYFRGDGCAVDLDGLIEDGLIVTNALILAEIVPALKLRRKTSLIDLLYAIESPALSIDWEQIIAFQVTCLKKGIHKVGIPDLLIAQHALEHGLRVYTLDKHFVQMSKHLPLTLYASC